MLYTYTRYSLYHQDWSTPTSYIFELQYISSKKGAQNNTRRTLYWHSYGIQNRCSCRLLWTISSQIEASASIREKILTFSTQPILVLAVYNSPTLSQVCSFFQQTIRTPSVQPIPILTTLFRNVVDIRTRARCPLSTQLSTMFSTDIRWLLSIAIYRICSCQEKLTSHRSKLSGPW